MPTCGKMNFQTKRKKKNNEVIFLHIMHSVVNGYMRYISSQKVSYMLSYVVIVYLTDICKCKYRNKLISVRCLKDVFLTIFFHLLCLMKNVILDTIG